MAEVFAGFVCGSILSIIAAPLVAYGLFRMRATSPLMARLLPEGVPAVSVTMIAHFGLLIFWTGAGIILGLLLLAMEGGGEALASANAPFTLIVFSFVLAISAPFAILIVPLRRYIVASALAALLVLGWLMPHMANWSKFD